MSSSDYLTSKSMNDFTSRLSDQVALLGNTRPVCCNSEEVIAADNTMSSRNCLLRLFCCSLRCVWASDASATIVCSLVIVVLSAAFQFCWVDEGIVIGDIHFWSPRTSTASSEASCELSMPRRNHISSLWYIATIPQLVLVIVTLYFLWATSLTNPGILKKQIGLPSVAPEGTLTQVETVRGIQVYRPYCPTCNIIRPVRVSHCGQCNNCVERFDHHCGVIGACIGRRNFHLFYYFLISVVILSLWSLGWSVTLAVGVYNCDMLKFGLSVVITLFAGVLALQLSAMTIYYIPLIAANKTKREDVKMDRLYHRPSRSDAHPFDHETTLDNCSAMLCERYDAETYV